MGIQGRTSLMLLEIDSYHAHYEHLKGIEECVNSAADLTRQLLGFARSGKYEVQTTDIGHLIGRSSEIFGRTKKEISIHRKYEDNIWPVDVDRGQIEQVLLNLYVNAWQAMPSGGSLYLETENVVVDEEFGRPHGIQSGKYVKIMVRDTGVGMDEKTRQRVFEPFFTTKEMGRGTGLGLASSYGIVRNHGGVITVSSEKSCGSTFTIYLPASTSSIKKESKSQQGAFSGSETILLVDDEKMILQVGKKMLEAIGYSVLTANSGKDAIDVYIKQKDSIAVVILDMIMPDLGGGETFEVLKSINQNVHVILSSGYSLDGQATKMLNQGCQGFLQKPFKLNDLSQKIREVLGNRSDPPNVG